ncbi:MAG: HAMP domain-containing protein [Nocardioidaceae bacterium]
MRKQLLLGLPLLLLVTSICGYLLAGAALRPVEEMRRRAATMSGGGAGQRLPLPVGNDEVARLGVTLNELLARVDATLERERAFVANASHEAAHTAGLAENRARTRGPQTSGRSRI